MPGPATSRASVTAILPQPGPPATHERPDWPQPNTHRAATEEMPAPRPHEEGQAQHAPVPDPNDSRVPHQPQSSRTSAPQTIPTAQYPPEPCLPQPMEMRKMMKRYGQPMSLQEWEARQSVFFPRTAMLPPGWTRAWDIVEDRVRYCRLDGSGDSLHFPTESAATEATARTPTRTTGDL